MRQKNQVLMFNDAELSLIQNTFAGDGEDFLYLIRNALLQFPMTKEELTRLRGVMTAPVYAVVKKKILPSIDPDAPLGQLGDLYQTLTNDLRTKDVDQMAPIFASKKLVIDYLTQQFEYLRDVQQDFTPAIILEDLKKLDGGKASAESWYINTNARNFVLSYVDSFLIQLRSIAGTPNETDEEKKKRLTRDSSK